MNSKFFTQVALVSILLYQSSFANNAAYEQRRNDYINNALINFGNDAILLQAYKNVPVDTAVLYSLLADISTSAVSDFGIVKLVRVLYFTNGEYDSVIFSTLDQIPFWLRKNENKNVYWSENHMVMWSGSEWLLHEKYGRPVDSTLRKRIVNFLKLKQQYGFYEFNSSVYAPYTLAGLLNLADFAQDAEIKNLAAFDAQRLLTDLLRFTNDKGVFFPTAGRNYYGKYETPYGQNHNNLIYLLTGMGQAPWGSSHAGCFLASSTLEVDSVINSWSPVLDTVYYNGHPIDSVYSVNDSIYGEDHTIFSWSGGGYFHPLVALESAQLLTDSNLWNHPEFSMFSSLSFATLSSIPQLAEELGVASKSSVILGERIVAFKHNSVTLSSVQDFWKGKVGFQQFPCVANVGTTAVFTASGEVFTDWGDRSDKVENEHLPYVCQHKNIALLMYRPEPTPALLQFNHKEVALYFDNADFDEIRENGLWLLGRQQNSYVAVRRNCVDTINGVRYCPAAAGQTWVIMVGDSGMYGSFDHFDTLIQQSVFETSWYYDSVQNQNIYYSKISVDTATIEYAWGVDSIAPSVVPEFTNNNNDWNIFPNPSHDFLVVNTAPSFTGLVSVFNLLGQEVYAAKFENNSTVIISTNGWSKGIYSVLLKGTETISSKKFLKE